MADFSTIIQEINDDINTNGVGAITGAKLNAVLRDIVAAVNAAKQDTMTIDATPTEDSTNPVQSGGVYSALQQKPTIYYVTDIQEIPPTTIAVLRGGDIVRYGPDYNYIAVVCRIDNNDIYLVETDGNEVDAFLYRNGVYYDFLSYQLSDFANKVPSATNGDLAGLGSNGNLTDSGIAASDVATTSDLAGKQDTISDLATIRSGAAAGATAVQPSDLATVATSGDYGDIDDKPQINGVTLTGNKSTTDIGINGIQSVTTQMDGTIVITLDDNSTITIDINHNHDQYFSKVIGTSQPVGGMLPDVVYKLGTLTGATTFSFAAAVSGNVNHYYFEFVSGSTAVVPTWPASITAWDGNCVDSDTHLPVIAANKTYEVSVVDGYAIIKEW